MAFTYYDTPEPVTPPTIGELVASLTAQQRGNILKAFRKENVDAARASKYLLIDFEIVDRLFKELKEIENRAKAYMLQQVVVTPAQYDSEGELVSPAVYNDAITGAADLVAKVAVDFSDDFSSQQVQAILTAMVEDSKRDGTGDWAYYSVAVTQ